MPKFPVRRFTSLALLMVAGAAPMARAAGLDDLNGRQLYLRFCSACHGEQGYGDGPVRDQFKTLIPDLTRITRRNSGVDPGRFPTDRIARIVDGRTAVAAHGTREMPVWGHAFADALGDSPEAQKQASAMVDRLVQYLADIQQ